MKIMRFLADASLRIPISSRIDGLSSIDCSLELSSPMDVQRGKLNLPIFSDISQSLDGYDMLVEVIILIT
jgi:hypothetical protein